MENNVQGERYILIAENVSYPKEVLTKIAQN
jgi:hypothetical protein